MARSRPPRRRWLVPEVVQTSAMDCGPAVLAALFEGFGIPVSYGRLREACQTDVDGTSIDVLEEVANRVGIEAEQVMIPGDQLLLAESESLPAIVIVRLPNGLMHFVLAWRRHGPLVQVMDPAVGRRWVRCDRFLEVVYIHTQHVPAADWREWAGGDGFLRPLARRLRDLGAGRDRPGLVAAAAEDPSWRSLARLDAATRFVGSLVRAGGLRRGHEARRALAMMLGDTGPEASGPPVIPETTWSVRPALSGPDSEDQVLLRGAVLVRVRGRRPDVDDPQSRAMAFSRELAAALAEPPSRPGRALLGLLRGEPASYLVLAIGLALAAGGAVLEALLLRGALDLGRNLGLVTQRLQALAAFFAFAGLLLLIEFGVAADLLRLGRHLEGRLRLAFLAKIPRLGDRYFHSRPISDMAERSHAVHQVRLLPRLAGQFVRAALALLVTVAAIAWVDPAGAPAAVLAAVTALGLPLIFLSQLQELDLRVRTHAGALSRFYLDALLGLSAIRAHGAERAVLREHEGLLVEWARAGGRLLGWVVTIEAAQLLAGFSLAGGLLLRHTGRPGESAAVLLLAYWALNLPTLGEEMARLVRQYPTHRNVTLRLLEPLGAPEDEPAEDDSPRTGAAEPGGVPAGVAIAFESVCVHAAGHTILRGVDAQIGAGEHVAIVGASGAGKSSLVGLLLGWHRAADGRVLVDGQPLGAERLGRLRAETTWVEPAVRLWNRSLLDNLVYGAPDDRPSGLGDVLRAADLHEVLRHLPEGLQTPIGEGGGLLSGGEGQRVRFGRALARPGARLVILDEPFRGLDRSMRRTLLDRARDVWRDATLLCITHDIGETLGFDRVLVVEAGRIIEDGRPARLAQATGSRYRALLEAEDAVRTGLWSDARWRRLRVVDGHLEDPREGRP
jgi:ATP-binding cassette subfamily B protein